MTRARASHRVCAIAIPDEIEEYRDARWRRDVTCQVESVSQAERFIEQVGFAACMTDSRRPGPSLYVAVCGRRDAVMPRNVQKDPEASLTWHAEGRDPAARPRLLRQARARQDDVHRAADGAVLPRDLGRAAERRAAAAEHATRARSCACCAANGRWRPPTCASESGIKDRAAFTSAIDELQAAMLVVPSEVALSAEVHLHLDARRRPLPRRSCAAASAAGRGAARDRARLSRPAPGSTVPGELARVTGLSRTEAGRGNRALVAEGYATMLATGVYRLVAPPQAEREDRLGDEPFDTE